MINVVVDSRQNKVFVYQPLGLNQKRNYAKELKALNFFYDVSNKSWSMSMQLWSELCLRYIGNFVSPGVPVLERLIDVCSDKPVSHGMSLC
jgi:hypothetical protein